MKRTLRTALIGLVSVLIMVEGGPAFQGRPLPRFRIKLIDGTTVTSDSLGGRVAVIDFWGTWCKPCLEEIPEYNAFYRQYKGRNVLFIAVAVESGSERELRDAARRLKIEYPVAAVSTRDLDQFGDIPVFPTTWVIGRQGTVRKELLGVSSGKHKAMRQLVDRLLAGG